MHPPRPRLTVRVGVAGHRWDKLKRQHTEAIRERLNQVFDSIEDVVDQVRTDPAAGYLDLDSKTPPPAAVLRVLSGLAEGTDRLGAQVARARKPNWLLTALLPFAREKFVLDFKMKKQLPDGTEVPCGEGEFGYGERDTASVQEFEELFRAAEAEGGVQELDGEAGKHGAYRQLATALCLNSDVVIAVWDGLQARAGGTGDIVRLARDYGIPVVRIPTDGVDNPWVNDPTEEDEGRGRGLRPLAEHFRRLLVAPVPSTEDRKENDNPRESYFGEVVRSMSSGRVYDWFFNLLAGKGPPNPKPASANSAEAPDHPADEDQPAMVGKLRVRWEREWTAQGASDALCSALSDTGIYRHYAWASHLATYNAGCYRSAFLVNYMFSWLAVAAAALGITFQQAGRSDLVLITASMEVLFLGSIMWIVVYSGSHRYHTQWLDCRRLAEWIRLLPMLLPLSRTPVLGVEANPVLSSQESWVDWMFRAVVREAGVLPLDVAQQIDGARGILAVGVLEGQIAYHGRTAQRNRRVDAFLHWTTKIAFLVALAAAVIHFTGLSCTQWSVLRPTGFCANWPVSGLFEEAVLVLSLAIPALGGAMHGLRSQGDYEATAARSTRIMERLQELQRELNDLKTPSVTGMAEIAVKTASVMSAELSAWLVAYQSKGIQTT